MQTPRPRPGRPPPGPEGGDAARAAAGLDTPPHPTPPPRRGSRRHRAWRAPQEGWHRGGQEGVGGGR